MDGWRHTRTRAYRPIPDFLKMRAALVALTAASAAALLALTALLPRPQVLPMLGLLAFAGAGVVALMAWWRNTARDVEQVTGWDVAGALILIGCAAGIFSAPEHVLQLFGHAQLNN